MKNSIHFRARSRSGHHLLRTRRSGRPYVPPVGPIPAAGRRRPRIRHAARTGRRRPRVIALAWDGRCTAPGRILPLNPKTGLRPQPRIGAVSHSQFCGPPMARVHVGCTDLILSRSFVQNWRYSSFLLPAGPAVAARTDFCQSLGSATTLNSGAGAESPILTTSSSTPKKCVSWSLCSFSQVSAWRCSSRNRVVIYTMMEAAVPAAYVSNWPR
jgi:hypothetical protein